MDRAFIDLAAIDDTAEFFIAAEVMLAACAMAGDAVFRDEVFVNPCIVQLLFLIDNSFSDGAFDDVAASAFVEVFKQLLMGVTVVLALDDLQSEWFFDA